MCLWSGGLGKMERMKVLVLKLNLNRSHALRIMSKKKLLSLGPKVLSHHSNVKHQEFVYTFSIICSPDLAFYTHFLQKKNIYFPPLAPQFPVRQTLGNDNHSIILVFSSDNWKAKHSYTHIQDTSQNKMRRKQRKERKEMLYVPQTLFLLAVVAIAVFL